MEGKNGVGSVVVKETITRGRTTGGEYTIIKYRCEGCDNLHDSKKIAEQCERDCMDEIEEALTISHTETDKVNHCDLRAGHQPKIEV